MRLPVISLSPAFGEAAGGTNLYPRMRPEQLTVSRRGKLTGTVSHLEHLGAETNIFVNTDGGMITVLHFDEVSHDIGAKISLTFKDEDMLYFDRDQPRLQGRGHAVF